MAQTEFDRQAEVTRLLLEGISSTHVSPVLFPLSSHVVFATHVSDTTTLKFTLRQLVNLGGAEPMVLKVPKRGVRPPPTPESKRPGQKTLDAEPGSVERGVGSGLLRPPAGAGSATASSGQVNHLRCLHEFIESQTTYYAQCYRHMLDLQKQLGRCQTRDPGSQLPRTQQAPVDTQGGVEGC